MFEVSTSSKGLLNEGEELIAAGLEVLGGSQLTQTPGYRQDETEKLQGASPDIISVRRNPGLDVQLNFTAENISVIVCPHLKKKKILKLLLISEQAQDFPQHSLLGLCLMHPNWHFPVKELLCPRVHKLIFQDAEYKIGI